MGVSIQLGWGKLCQDLIDVLFLDFLWNPGAVKVVVGFIVPHLLPVTIRVWNLMKLVIVVAMDNFASAFNVIKAFVDGDANLMPWCSVIIRLEWISVWVTRI